MKAISQEHRAWVLAHLLDVAPFCHLPCKSRIEDCDVYDFMLKAKVPDQWINAFAWTSPDAQEKLLDEPFVESASGYAVLGRILNLILENAIGEISRSTYIAEIVLKSILIPYSSIGSHKRLRLYLAEMIKEKPLRFLASIDGDNEIQTVFRELLCGTNNSILHLTGRQASALSRIITDAFRHKSDMRELIRLRVNEDREGAEDINTRIKYSGP